MKKFWPALVAALTGIFVIAALILRPKLDAYLGLILQWAVITASMALLVAIAKLAINQLSAILTGRKGFIFSIVGLATFIISLVGGLRLGVDNAGYQQWISAIQTPLEVSLLGLTAIVLTSASVQVFRKRGWTPLTVSFGLSAIVFLIVQSGFISTSKFPQLAPIFTFLQQVPTAGARGLLIGVAAGALLMAVRVIFGMERPASD